MTTQDLPSLLDDGEVTLKLKLEERKLLLRIVPTCSSHRTFDARALIRKLRSNIKKAHVILLETEHAVVLDALQKILEHYISSLELKKKVENLRDKLESIWGGAVYA